ncbi:MULTISPECIES: LuxR C-terminal-related transcriptional regulator [Mesorhizobium]|nr:MULTISPECIES: response regulator transcription factor [Mesorhizobium]
MKKRVLLADDHAFVSWGIAKALGVLDDVEIIGIVPDGIRAIIEIRKSKPDCAILDHNMPGATGLEVFLESKRWCPDTRFVLLTGTATAATLRKLVEAGIHGICLKEGGESEFIDVVRRVLAGATAVSAGAALLMKSSRAHVQLTDREIAVLIAIARGQTNAGAAEALGVSPKTIDTHRTNLLRKFEVNSTASLLLAAVRIGLLDPDNIR